MKAIACFKVSGSMLLLAGLLAGCNKQQDRQGGAASAINAPPPGSSATMMGPGMQHGPASSASNQGGPMTPMQNGMMPASMLDQMRASCPMLVADTLVQVDDTDKGVALSFTTQKGDVGDLRARVAHLAQMYQMRRGQGPMMMWHQMAVAGAGMHGGNGMGMTSGNAGHMGNADHRGMGNGMGMGPGGSHMDMGSGMMAAMPAVKVAVGELPNGAKLVLAPNDPAELSIVRAQARQHQEHMQSGQCWMPQRAASDSGTKAP